MDGLRHPQDKDRLAALISWLASQQETKALINALRTKVDAEKLVVKSNFPCPPRATTPEEVRAFGLYLMQNCKDKGWSLHTASHQCNIRVHGSRAQDYIDACMDEYINPFLDWIDSELSRLGDAVSIEAIADNRLTEIFSPAFQEDFPETAAVLSKTVQMVTSLGSDGPWFTVATACREVFVAFVKELQKQNLKPCSDLKASDVKGWIKHILGDKVSSSGKLAELVAALWDYTQSLVHRQSTTKAEALRVYLWTGLLVSEIYLLLKTGGGSIA